MELETDRLLLRAFRPDDHEAVHAYATDPEVLRYTDWGPNTPEDTAAFFVAVADAAAVRPRTSFTFAVVDRVTGGLVGATHLMVASVEHRRGEIGYTLGRQWWGRGYATEAADAVLRFGFGHLGLHKISATCDPENIASARVLTKIGMSREGYLREHAYIRGRWRDRLLFAALVADTPAGPAAPAARVLGPDHT